MTWSLYSRMLRFRHAFHGRDMRLRLGALLLVLVVEGCAATATSDGAAPRPPLPLGELLLVGFAGTQVEGNLEIRALVCDVKVGGLILFERDARTGEARNITDPEQVRRLTADLQALARECAGRPLLIAADNEGGLVMRLSTRVGYLPTPPPSSSPGAWAPRSERPASTGTSPPSWTWRSTRSTRRWSRAAAPSRPIPSRSSRRPARSSRACTTRAS